ncbi:MAG: FAD-dependent oxidoreductase [Alphaproteobacteria bacterium]
MSEETQTPFQAAIVGSGPSGFYAAEALLRSGENVRVDMFERLPTPFGLVRGGVAPDHPKIKKVANVYDRTARKEHFRFFGNVGIGEDVSIDDLRRAYHAVIFAYGASESRRLGIPGDDLSGSHTATEFVGWYNGHPDFTDLSFDLSHETAAVIGQGNVAADLARILLTPVEQLERTDIADHALEALRSSAVRHVHVIGRRGPAQAKFTPKELEELGQIEGCLACADPADLELNRESREELEDSKNRSAVKNMELFREFARNDPCEAERTCRFRFFESPAEILGDDRVQGLALRRNRLTGEPFRQRAEGTDETRRIDCGLVFASIGYRGVPISGLPFDPDANVIPNEKGRILKDGRPMPGLYVAGWIKRGATGLIGNNRACSTETVQQVLEDAAELKSASREGGAGILRMLQAEGVPAVSYAGWDAIDAAEREAGAACGKERRKFVRVADMLELVAPPDGGGVRRP